MELFAPSDYVYREKKKIVIYGFNHFTEASLLFLASHNIYVSAFLSESNEVRCREYLGKKILTIDGLSDEYRVYDLFGENVISLKEQGVYARTLLTCNADKDVVIYGAGRYGKVCYEILKKYGIQVRVFCDQDKSKVGNSIFDCKIIHKEELMDYKDCEIVIGLDTYRARALEDEFKIQYGEERIFYNNWSNYFIWGGNPIDPFRIYYMRHRGKKMTLIGYKDDIIDLLGMLRCFDIVIDRAVDHNGYVGEEGIIRFVDRYELVYEEDPTALYCVMENGKEIAGRFIDEIGFKRSRFIFNFIYTIGNFDAALDVNMGYNKAESIHILKSGNGNDLKIGILGGSTSDIDLYGEKSWVEYLCDILGKKNINTTFYAGAEKAYSSAQELIKLCRDMILYKPDIIISYSGVNDYPCLNSRRNTFITNYQEELFNTIIRSSISVEENKWVEGTRKVLCYGSENNDFVEGWIRNERIMHGVCNEYGITFYSILQPCLFSEEELNNPEQELIEMSGYIYEKEETDETIRILTERYNRVREMNIPWLHDFSAILKAYQGAKYFDKYHVFEEVNSYIATRIFALIKTDIESLLGIDRKEGDFRCIY